MTGKLQKMSFGVGVFLVVILLVVILGGSALLSRGVSGINQLPVFVVTTNGLVNNIANPKEKISSTEIEDLKHAVMKSRAVLGLYTARRILVLGPTNAAAYFTRHDVVLQIKLVKSGGTWVVQSQDKIQVGQAKPMTSMDEVLNHLSIAAP